MPNSFKISPTHFSRGTKNFLGGLRHGPVYTQSSPLVKAVLPWMNLLFLFVLPYDSSNVTRFRRTVVILLARFTCGG